MGLIQDQLKTVVTVVMLVTKCGNEKINQNLISIIK